MRQIRIDWAMGDMVQQLPLMTLRSLKDFPLRNPNFIGVAVALLAVFALYLWEFYLVSGLPAWWVGVTGFLYGMSLWSYVVVVVTDPGRVPVMWGLYNSDPLERKFCLLCGNFKPARCHHCSQCKQCVLNMDHHCPWINNCVGFYNRKYFLLFLLYLLLALLIAIVQMVIVEVGEISALAANTRTTDIHTFLRIATLLFCLVLFVTLALFFNMHMGMVLDNTTTLESMVRDRKLRNLGSGEQLEENPYDIGTWYNFTQVFGENIFYWLVPLEEEFPLKSKGVFWEHRTLRKEASGASNEDTQKANGQKQPTVYTN